MSRLKRDRWKADISLRVPTIDIPEPSLQASYNQQEAVKQKPSWWHHFWQIARFAIVGCLNTVIDLLVLNALLWLFPTQNTLIVLGFNSFAYTTGAINSFLLNKYWTFQRQGRITIGEVLRFLLTTGAGVLCSDVLLWGAVVVLRPLIANQMVLTNIAKIVAVLGMATISYLGMRLWVFVRTSREREHMHEHRSSSPYLSVSADDPHARRRREPLLTQGLSVVLPAHNEEENITRTISEVTHMLQIWVQDFEIIVVNDGSTDATDTILGSLARQDAHVRVITHPANCGYGAALASGFHAIQKELVFFMDSDGQFDIMDLERFFPYIKDYDAVIGHRMQRQDNWLRRLNAWGWKLLVGAVLGIHVRDIDCAFKLYHANFLHRHRFETRGAMTNAEMLYKLMRDRGTIKEIGVRHFHRQAGRATGANIKVILRAFRELWVYARRWKREEKKYGHVV